MSKKVYAAVRNVDGSEWIDSETVSPLPEMAKDIADKCDRQLPAWALSNPVVRIALFEMTEVG